MKRFGERLRQAMDGANIKPKQLADRSGVSQRYISALLAGENETPRVDKAWLLARALGTSIDWLVTGEMFQNDQLSPQEVALVAAFRSLPETGRKSLLRIVHAYSDNS